MIEKKPIVVLKVGTSTLMDPVTQLPSLRNLGTLVETVVDLRKRGYDVVLVTSGAVGFGCRAMGLSSRPNSTSGKHAMAALGQAELMRVYMMMFDLQNVKCAQLLITRPDFVHKTRYMNFRQTMMELLHHNIVPVINENDAVSSDDLKFGDNDSLSAHLAVLCEAEWLFLLTDVDCLYTANPRTDVNAKAISWVPKLETLRVDTGGAAGGTSWGTGGMATKLVAAQIATAAGVHTVLANGMYPMRAYEILKREDIHTKAFQGQPSAEEVCEDGYAYAKDFASLPWPGTVFRGAQERQTLKTRRRWILSLPVKGRVMVDAGAARAIKKGWSLLAVGVIGVKGRFLADESVVIVTPKDAMKDALNFSLGDGELSAHSKQMSSSHLLSPGSEDNLVHLAQNSLSVHVPGATPQVAHSGSTPPKSPLCPPSSDGHDWNNVVEVAHCLISCTSDELRTLKGKSSAELEKMMGIVDPEVAHRQDIVLLGGVIKQHK